MKMGNRKTMSILDFIDRKAVSAQNDFIESLNTAITAIARGLWYLFNNREKNEHCVYFTAVDVLKYGGCKAKACGCGITIELINRARYVLYSLVERRYLTHEPGIISIYGLCVESGLWKAMERAKDHGDIIEFIRRVVIND
jgi:hypothetical protein